jgi:hypothetical protein
MVNKNIIETLHLFTKIDFELIELLKSLSPNEWNCQTIAKLWTVKDVASHLLDGNLRALSVSRDNYILESTENINSFQELTSYINNLNNSWVSATKRLSPKIIINLLEITNSEYYNHLKTLNLFDEAIYSVAWSGQSSSPNWFHIAREYTEKFLHQQQIRDALGRQGIMTKELFYPFVDILMYAFPYTFRQIDAMNGTIVSIKVNSDIGGIWSIIKTSSGWILDKSQNLNATSIVIINPDTLWKLFSKSLKPEDVLDKVEMKGDLNYAKHMLSIVAVMA